MIGVGGRQEDKPHSPPPPPPTPPLSDLSIDQNSYIPNTYFPKYKQTKNKKIKIPLKFFKAKLTTKSSGTAWQPMMNAVEGTLVSSG